MKRFVLFCVFGVFLSLKMHAQQIPVSPKLEFNKIQDIDNEFYNRLTVQKLLRTYSVNKTTASYLITDSIVSWRSWDTLQAKWKPNPSLKYIDFKYDSRANLIGFTIQENLFIPWLNRSKYLLTFNVNGNILTRTSQTWDGNAWINSKLESFTYSQGNKTIHLIQQWDGSNWINSIKNSYDYDASNNEIMYLEQLWNGTIWVDFEKYLKTYNSKNSIISSINLSWSGNSWGNAYKEIYHYNADHNLDTQTKQIWNGVWKNMEQIVFEYDLKLNRIAEVS